MSTKRRLVALAAVPIAAVLIGGAVVLSQASAAHPGPTVTPSVVLYHAQEPDGHDVTVNRGTTVTVRATQHHRDDATSSAIAHKSSAAATAVQHGCCPALTSRSAPTVTATWQDTDDGDRDRIESHSDGHIVHSSGTASTGEHHDGDCGD